VLTLRVQHLADARGIDVGEALRTSRFFACSRRVIRLRVSGPPMSPRQIMVDECIFGVWQAHQAELFPRLRSVCLDYRDLYIQSYAEAMFAFITPAIQTVHVYIDRDFCQLIGKMRTMAGIASRCRATTLGLHQTFAPTPIRARYTIWPATAPLSTLVCSLPALARVTIPAFLAGSTLPHLASCANLRELTITGKGKTIRNTLPIDLPPNSFPVLDTVCIEESGTTACLSKAMFQRSPTGNLQHVKVKSRVLPLHEWTHLCTWMGAHTSLTSVSLEMTLPPEDDLVDLPIHLLQPLTTLARLEVLNIRSSHPLPIDEHDLLDAVPHWPSLRSFRMQQNASQAHVDPSCGISLMAFCAVLGMCPHLTVAVPCTVLVRCAAVPQRPSTPHDGQGRQS
jgi:hypothetical protein